MAQGSPSRACCTTQRMTAVTPSHFPAIEAADGFHPLPVVEYFRRLIWTGGVAGLLVGLIITVIQTVTIYPLLRAAEQYETAAAPSHDHVHEPVWEPADGPERLGFSTLANIVIGSGYGLLLAGLFALRDGPVGLRRGRPWGVAGFVCVAVAPALGLPPPPPA